MKKISNKFDSENIKYCIMTIIQNEISLFEYFLKSFTENYEHKIVSNDTIILEFDGELYELNSININNNFINIIYENNGYLYDIFPKMIIGNKMLIPDINLIFIEPIYDKKIKCLISNSTDIYKKFGNFTKDISYYNVSYKNANTNKINLSFMKVKYNGEKTSKYIIAYDYKFLDKEKIFMILKKIFLK